MFFQNIIIFFLASLAFSLLLLVVASIFSVKVWNIFKTKSYECGFKNFDHNARQTIDIHFFFVGVLFVLFDLEVILLFPWALNYDKLSYNGLFSVFIFLFLLILSYWYELKEGLLNWSTTDINTQKLNKKKQ